LAASRRVWPVRVPPPSRGTPTTTLFPAGGTDGGRPPHAPSGKRMTTA
jgi:hypothetical protein